MEMNPLRIHGALIHVVGEDGGCDDGIILNCRGSKVQWDAGVDVEADAQRIDVITLAGVSAAPFGGATRGVRIGQWHMPHECSKLRQAR